MPPSFGNLPLQVSDQKAFIPRVAQPLHFQTYTINDHAALPPHRDGGPLDIRRQGDTVWLRRLIPWTRSITRC